MKTALVITTYNNPQSLGICLQSLTLQSEKDFYLYIADDGSTEETKNKIDSFAGKFKHPIRHVWHEDQGYQKAKINNLVFKELTDFDVIICIDHDVVLHEHFIADHIEMHKKYPNLLFMGRRVELSPQYTKTVTEENVHLLNKGLNLNLLISGIKKESKNISRAFRFKNPFLQQIFKRNDVKDLLGSNFSVTKELLFKVNGFNEDHKSYWGEDGDLFVRLRNAGANIIGLKSFAIQYHLYHERMNQTREQEEHYQSLLEKKDYIRCERGISQ